MTNIIRVRATFDAYRWVDECEACGSESIDWNDADGYLIGRGRVRCLDCGHVAVPAQNEHPHERGGWVDPSNPWGSFEQDRDDDSTEPNAVEFETIREAVEFLREFPGGIWDIGQECEPEQDYRTGEWKAVTAHVDGNRYAVDAVLHYVSTGRELAEVTL